MILCKAFPSPAVVFEQRFENATHFTSTCTNKNVQALDAKGMYTITNMHRDLWRNDDLTIVTNDIMTWALEHLTANE
jgi:hypothetical protein